MTMTLGWIRAGLPVLDVRASWAHWCTVLGASRSACFLQHSGAPAACCAGAAAQLRQQRPHFHTALQLLHQALRAVCSCQPLRASPHMLLFANDYLAQAHASRTCNCCLFVGMSRPGALGQLCIAQKQACLHPGTPKCYNWDSDVAHVSSRCEASLCKGCRTFEADAPI